MSDFNTWMNKFLKDFYTSIHANEQNNYDSYFWDRFLGNQGDRLFLINNHVEYMKFFIENAMPLFYSRSLLADDASKQLFDALLLYRLLGHHHVRLPTCNSKYFLLPSYSNSGHFLFDLRPGRRLICLKMLANC